MTRDILTLSGAAVSRFAFGTMQFGGRADAEQGRAMYDACRAAGINHFDTAFVYTDGRSESLLGQFSRGERDDVLIATKAGYTGGAGPENLQAQLDESRRRLGMEMVDTLYLHRFDTETPLEVSLGWFAQQKSAGNIRYLGLSNFAAWQVMKAAAAGASLGLTVDLLQPMYSLVKRQAEVEILPMCQSEGILAATYSPLGAGTLTGKYAGQGTGRLTEDPRYRARYGHAWMDEAGGKLAAIAAEMGTHPATLAVAWAAAHPSRPSPIISARNTEQLAPSLAALDYAMDADLYARMAALTPAPPPADDRLEEA
jgi:aryl-alcohol dehydrogenase-like predicted oxidoreductase